MQWVLYGIMAVAAVIMIWANQQFNSKGAAWGRPVAALFGVVAVIMAGWAIYYQFTKGAGTRKRLEEIQAYYRDLSMNVLGDYIGKTWPDKTIVTVDFYSGPGAAGQPSIQAQKLAAFEGGLAGRCRIVGKVELGKEEAEKMAAQASNDPSMPPEAMGMMIMGPEMFTAEQFDKIIKENDADIIVCFAGLPMDYQALKYWKLPKDKQPILILEGVPDMTDTNLQKAVAADGLIGAVLVGNPAAGYDPEADIPDDPKVAFDSRYLLITQDNIRDQIQKNPTFFGSK